MVPLAALDESCGHMLASQRSMPVQLKLTLAGRTNLHLTAKELPHGCVPVWRRTQPHLHSHNRQILGGGRLDFRQHFFTFVGLRLFAPLPQSVCLGTFTPLSLAPRLPTVELKGCPSSPFVGTQYRPSDVGLAGYLLPSFVRQRSPEISQGKRLLGRWTSDTLRHVASSPEPSFPIGCLSAGAPTVRFKIWAVHRVSTAPHTQNLIRRSHHGAADAQSLFPSGSRNRGSGISPADRQLTPLSSAYQPTPRTFYASATVSPSAS